MIGAGVLVLAVAVLVAVLGPPLGRRLPPAMATRVLVPAAVAVAMATGAVLGIAAFTLIGQVPQIAEAGRWSAQVVRDADPVPAVIAVVCGLLVLYAAGRAIVLLVRRVVAFTRVQAACRDHRGGTLIVLDDDRPDAFATAGWRARIVVTTGLLRALDRRQRQVVLAHERSHVIHRHAWWILAADLAAAANPLLTPTARTVAHAVERWADEDAAAEVADRRLVARAVGRAALLRRRFPPAPAPTPSAVGGNVPDRVAALLEPAPERRLRHVVLLAVLLLVLAGGSALVSERGRELFAHADISQQHD
ncbi:M48 family metalloprotease [Amycolatopsis sp. NPDC101161]|uniref:M48 family metalloprotease n=1 Tax=Amycolatopsis sp. NPDC101161 TaxID=3363940 RepID=UPI0037FFDD9C